MNIQQAATEIISQWEHGGRFDCHGNGAYGLIGWQGEQLTHLLSRYVQMGGKLMYLPQSYADGLMTVHQNGELNEVAADSLMQNTQRSEAEIYMDSAIRWQWRFYPFKTAMGQLICCDIGVNSGISNWYVKHSDAHLGDDELIAIKQTMLYRRQALQNYGIWGKYPGIRRRWDWYYSVFENDPDLDLKPMQPTADVNGHPVNLGLHHIKPLTA